MSLQRNQKVFLFFFSLLIGLFIHSPSRAQEFRDSHDASRANPKRSLKVSVGGATRPATAQTTQGIDLLLSVEGQALAGNFENRQGKYFVLARIKASASGLNTATEVIDLDLQGLGIGFQLNNGSDSSFKGFAELGTLHTIYSQDLALNNKKTLSISIAGARIGGEGNVTDWLNLYGHLALEFAAYGVSERLSDLQKLSTHDSATQVEFNLGAEFFKKFRVIYNAQTTKVGADPYEVEVNGEEYCHFEGTGEYIPTDNGYEEILTEDCSGIVTRTHQNAGFTKQTLAIEANLNKRIQAFGSATYAVYEMTDELRRFPNSRHSGWRLRFGLRVGI